MDMTQLLFVSLGIVGGAAVGFWINRRRVRDGAPSARALRKQAEDPARSALQLAFAGFVGMAIAQDLIGTVRPLVPELVALKYLFATVLGVGHWLFLRRVAADERAAVSDR